MKSSPMLGIHILTNQRKSIWNYLSPKILVNAATTGMGLLTISGPQSWHPAQQGMKQLCASAAFYTKERDVVLGRLAVSYAQQQTGFHTLLVGINCSSLLRFNLELVYAGFSSREKETFRDIHQSMSLPETYVVGFHNEEAVRKMPYTLLGKTGLTVSKLSFGGGALSGFYDEFDEEEAVQTVREAVRLGVNYIDTAPFYGQGRSERILGKALAEVPRKAYYISTKVGRYGKERTNMFDHSARKIKSAFNESLALLGLDYVDIVFVHDIEFADMEQVLNESLQAVAQLVQEKKARFIGVSGYPVSVLKQAIESSTQSLDVVLTYARDTLFDKSAKVYLELFKTKDLGVVNAAATGMGLLTNSGPQAWHPAQEGLKQLCASAAFYAKERDVELGRLAVSYALQQPGYHTLLVGINSSSLLHSNLELVYSGLSSQEKETLRDIQQRFFNPSSKNWHWEGLEFS